MLYSWAWHDTKGEDRKQRGIYMHGFIMLPSGLLVDSSTLPMVCRIWASGGTVMSYSQLRQICSWLSSCLCSSALEYKWGHWTLIGWLLFGTLWTKCCLPPFTTDTPAPGSPPSTKATRNSHIPFNISQICRHIYCHARTHTAKHYLAYHSLHVCCV